MLYKRYEADGMRVPRHAVDLYKDECQRIVPRILINRLMYMPKALNDVSGMCFPVE